MTSAVRRLLMGTFGCAVVALAGSFVPITDTSYGSMAQAYRSADPAAPEASKTELATRAAQGSPAELERTRRPPPETLAHRGARGPLQASSERAADPVVSQRARRKVARLPVPKAPPRPPRTTEFAAPDNTQAGQAARQIAARIRSFTVYRDKIRGAAWVVHPAARWQIRGNEHCYDALRAAGVPFKAATANLPTPVPAPVEVMGPVDGVRFHMTHPNRTLLMSCELAARLPVIARVLKKHGVVRVAVISTYRDKPIPSFHTFGMGLDISQFYTADATLNVLNEFVTTPGYKTCEAPDPKQPHAKALLEIACELAATDHFSSVLTPNYNKGHRNHFHIDIRPNDPRFFVR